MSKEVKKGYKQTEVGVIPEDWEVKKLGEICSSAKERFNPKLSSKNYRCVELEHLSQGTGRLLGYIDSSQQLSQKSFFRKEDVLFGKLRPYLKKYLFADFEGVCSTEIWVLKSEKNIINKYLFYLIQTNRVLESANQSTGTKMPRAEWITVSNLEISIPRSKIEQTAIAEVLFNTDELITSIEKLILKKRNIKQGAMQQLLTGKKRLPGFENKKGYKQTEIGVIPEDWEFEKLNTIADVRDGTHDSPKYFKDGVKFITSKNIVNGSIDYSDVSYISYEDAANIDKRSKVNRGDILMSMIGTIGNSVLIDFDPDFCIKNVALIKSCKIKCQYLVQLLFSNYYYTYICSKLDGGIQKFISLGALRDLDVPFPLIQEEQTSIAEVLSDMDAEIETLEKKLAKYKDIKQGMMQELLTGKRRLI